MDTMSLMCDLEESATAINESPSIRRALESGEMQVEVPTLTTPAESRIPQLVNSAFAIFLVIGDNFVAALDTIEGDTLTEELRLFCDIYTRSTRNSCRFQRRNLK